ncbi:MAG TPA: hypothetical protein VFS43_16805 [Polyangiaceae bacterium]|nr:hypothetical protein [Polyangiaceae bacterium]
MTIASVPGEAPPRAPAARSPYIAGRAYDWAFFLLPPLVALGLGALLSGTSLSTRKFWLGDHRTTWATLFIGSLTHAHLVAVFFRSHLNPAVFQRHPVRFIAAPLLLFAAMRWSMPVLIVVTVVVVYWDVYHSGLQTFGFARIYDRNAGNDPAAGRRLDFWLNHLLYAGPILGGAVMLAHAEKLEMLDELGWTPLASVPPFLAEHQRGLTLAVLALGTAFLVAYVLGYVRLYRRGYRVSWLKVYLLASTGVCSIYTWGFNAFGEAFFIMNFFHAVQYLGLVWWSEGKHLKRRLRVGPRAAGTLVAVFAFLGPVLAYGALAEIVEPDLRSLWCLTQVVAVMHFWYDGFIWSVSRKQV